MLKILEHHVERVKSLFEGITDYDKARKASAEWVEYLKAEKWPDGTLIYPNLNEQELGNRLATLIFTVNSGDYETLPEWSGTIRNKDFICEVCGNLEPSAASKEGTMCGADRKSSFYRRLINPLSDQCQYHKRESGKCDYSECHRSGNREVKKPNHSNHERY